MRELVLSALASGTWTRWSALGSDPTDTRMVHCFRRAAVAMSRSLHGCTLNAFFLKVSNSTNFFSTGSRECWGRSPLSTSARHTGSHWMQSGLATTELLLLLRGVSIMTISNHRHPRQLLHVKLKPGGRWPARSKATVSMGEVDISIRTSTLTTASSSSSSSSSHVTVKEVAKVANQTDQPTLYLQQQQQPTHIACL